jgi:hypothetical protein
VRETLRARPRGARRLTNRAFDALNELGDWVAGKD